VVKLRNKKSGIYGSPDFLAFYWNDYYCVSLFQVYCIIFIFSLQIEHTQLKLKNN